jgi:hypothetical protein
VEEVKVKRCERMSAVAEEKGAVAAAAKKVVEEGKQVSDQVLSASISLPSSPLSPSH